MWSFFVVITGSCLANRTALARRRPTMCLCRCDPHEAGLGRVPAGGDRDTGARMKLSLSAFFSKIKKRCLNGYGETLSNRPSVNFDLQPDIPGRRMKLLS